VSVGGLPAAIHVVDSHTEGEPTRVVVSGWPQPAGDTMQERLAFMRGEQDHLRTAVVCEPRGHDAIVGALLTPPVAEDSAAGVVFFNNGTWLGMCGHGLIGVVRTLEFLGRLAPGVAKFDTPVGTVTAALSPDGTVTIENVPAYVHARGVTVDVAGYGTVTGDVAWGGNWFFITHESPVPVDMEHVRALTHFTHAVQDAIRAAGISGADGADIDHIEISAPPSRADADARNYVLCSGGDYDRSPCGTGTSARMAQLVGRGRLKVGDDFVHESIIGSLFDGRVEDTARVGNYDAIVPSIAGWARQHGVNTITVDDRDPFAHGFQVA